MIKKALSTIDTIKIWLFIPLVTIVLWFMRAFYNQQEDISKDVGTIKMEVQAHTYKVEALEERLKSQEYLTKQLYKWQLEKHSTQNDTIEENY